MKDKNVRNSGMGFISVLTLIFIVLKLTNNISWSWKNKKRKMVIKTISNL